MASYWTVLLICLTEMLSLIFIWKLWRSGEWLFFKVILTIIALIPICGPLFGYWCANFPPRLPPALQDRRRYSADVYDRWRSVLEQKNPQKRSRMAKAILNKKDEWEDPNEKL